MWADSIRSGALARILRVRPPRLFAFALCPLACLHRLLFLSFRSLFLRGCGDFDEMGLQGDILDFVWMETGVL